MIKQKKNKINMAPMEKILEHFDKIKNTIKILEKCDTPMAKIEKIQSYDEIDDNIKIYIDKSINYIRNRPKMMNENLVKCFQEDRLAKNIIIKSIILVNDTLNLYQTTKYKVGEELILISIVDSISISNKLGKTGFKEIMKYKENGFKCPYKKDEILIEENVYYKTGMIILKGLIAANIIKFETQQVEEKKIRIILPEKGWYDIKKWFDNWFLIDLPQFEKIQELPLSLSYKRGTYIYYPERNWKPVDDWEEFGKILKKLGGVGWKINNYMVQYLFQELEQKIENIRKNEIGMPPENPLKMKGYKYDPLRELTKEEKKIYKEYKEVDLKRYFENIINVNKDIEEIFAIYTAYILKIIDETFYFEHHLDFRGRIYKKGLFNYDRGDIYRSLLDFAQAEIITKDTEKWLYNHVASLLELPKGFTLEDKINVVLNKEEVFRKWVQDPKKNNEWTKYDDKFQLLRGAYELIMYWDAKKTGKEWYSNLPLVFDMTNSSYQILSGLSLSNYTASMTNLIDSEKPNDMYNILLDNLYDYLKHSLKSDQITCQEKKKIKEIINNKLINRKDFKKVLMTLPYGISDYGISKHLRKSGLPHIALLKKMIINSIKKDLICFKTIEEYIKTIVMILYKIDATIEWVSVANFKMNAMYHKMKKIRHRIGNTSVIFNTLTKEKDLQKTLQAVIANVCHQQDASVLHLFVKNTNISQFNCLHDSYQTTAKYADILHNEVRNAFYNVFKERTFLLLIREQAIEILKEKNIDPDKEFSLTINKKKIYLQIPNIPNIQDGWDPILVKSAKYFMH